MKIIRTERKEDRKSPPSKIPKAQSQNLQKRGRQGRGARDRKQRDGSHIWETKGGMLATKTSREERGSKEKLQ